MGRGFNFRRRQQRCYRERAYAQDALAAFGPLAQEPIITGPFSDLESLMEVVFEGVSPSVREGDSELPLHLQQRLQEVSAGCGAGLVEALMPPYLHLADDGECFDGAEMAAVNHVDVHESATDLLTGL